MIQGSIQEDIILINIYELYKIAPKYIKQILTDIKGEIDKNTIIVGDSTTPVTPCQLCGVNQIVSNKDPLRL